MMTNQMEDTPPPANPTEPAPTRAAIPKIVLPPARIAAESQEASLPQTPATPSARPLFFRRALKLLVSLGVVLAILFGFYLAFRVGHSRGWRRAILAVQAAATPAPAPTPTVRELPQELLPELNAALALLRKGENLEALEALNKLQKAHPDAPSLDYAASVGALQAGYPREADRLADASIAKGFRVSDCLALKAAILASQSKDSASDREALLRKSIASDPMNPDPFIELVALLRSEGKTGECAGLLESARLRLNPADSAIVLDVTQAVLAVESGENLVPLSPPTGIPAKDFPNAYSEMKRGNFESAANILRTCQGMITPDLFSYLVNDPSLRKFATRPELAGFY